MFSRASGLSLLNQNPLTGNETLATCHFQEHTRTSLCLSPAASVNSMPLPIPARKTIRCGNARNAFDGLKPVPKAVPVRLVNQAEDFRHLRFVLDRQTSEADHIEILHQLGHGTVESAELSRFPAHGSV